MRSLLLLFSTFIVIHALSAFAQHKTDETIELERIRREIMAFKQQLANNTAKEKSILQSLQELDYEIGLREKLLRELGRTKKSLATRLQGHTASLDEYTAELVFLRKNFKKRAVLMYKYRRKDDLDHLVMAAFPHSTNKALSLRKYFRVLAKRDKRAIENITSKSRQMALRNESLASDLQRQKIFLYAADKETQLLHARKREREELLAHIDEDNTNVQLALAEQEKAELALLNELTALHDAAARWSESHVTTGFARFSRMKGRLPLPADGYVVSHIGIEYNPVTKIKTLNRGVDILSRYGAAVKAVCDGRVAKIKWLPWFGQTIVIQHSEGYYTVYARLSEISLNLNESVITGQVIGKVGKEATTSKAKLHFQIWKGSAPLDPEGWFSAKNITDAEQFFYLKKPGK